MAIPSLGMGRSVHRDPEILLWGVITGGKALQAQNYCQMLMPGAKGLSQLKVRSACKALAWLQLAAVAKEGWPWTLKSFQLYLLMCKSASNNGNLLYKRILMRINKALHVNNLAQCPVLESSL